MKTAETAQMPELKAVPCPERERGIVPVVRVFPWSITSAEDIISALQNGEELSFINILLVQKSQESQVSAGMLTPIGGKCELGEDIIQSALRELRQETTLQPCVFARQSQTNTPPALNEPYFSETGYCYTVSGYEPRKAYFVALPVLPEDQQRIHFPFGSENDKLATIYSIPFKNATNIFRSGTTKKEGGMQLIESCVYGQRSSSSFNIDNTQAEVKDKQLDLLFAYLEQTDARVAQLVKNKLLFVLKQSFGYNTDHLQALDLREMFSTLYQELGENFKPILARVLQEVQLEIYFLGFKKQQAPGKSSAAPERFPVPTQNPRLLKMARDAGIIRQEFACGNFGLDMLHALAFFNTDIVTARTSIGAVALLRFWKNALVESLETAVSQTPGLETVESYIQALQQTDNLLSADELYQRLEQTIIQTLALVLEQEPKQILDALRLTNEFINEMAKIANQLAAANDAYHRFQNHALSNEVNNAGIAELLFLSQGIGLDEYEPERARVIRFEAIRHLLIFTKILNILPKYQELTRGGNGPIAKVVGAFFGPQQGIAEFRLRDEHFANEVEIRRGGHGIVAGRSIIVDEKPTKSFFSFLRKSFQTKVEDIHDIFSTSIVPTDTEELTIPQQISYINQVADEFVAFIKEQFEQGYTVEVFDDRRETLDKLYALAADQEEPPEPISGKRSGSIANRIPRRKYIVRLTNKKNGKVYKSEFTFYPFVVAPKEFQETLMGWLEKLHDDQEYGIRRMVLDVKHRNLFGTLSLFELMFPANIYGETLQVRRHTISIK